MKILALILTSDLAFTMGMQNIRRFLPSKNSSFIQQLCIEHLLCAKHCSKYWGNISEPNKIPSLREPMI